MDVVLLVVACSTVFWSRWLVRRRSAPHLREGEQFVVIGKGDTVILKSISPPTLRDLSALLVEARRQARHAGLKQSSVKSAVTKVRRKR